MGEIRMQSVSKAFGTVKVIKSVDLYIKTGEFTVFVGPSGCGKSTLLRLVAGLEDISTGTLTIDGEVVNDVAPAKRGVAMVFQSYALYPHMTVYENMAFGLKLAKSEADEIDRRVRRAAEILRMDHLLDRKPKQLSGGQRQRVAIGRAITRDPKVFLFDEPLSNLDAALRVQMRLELAKLHRDLGATMIYVTHDQVEAMTLADKIVVLNGGVVEQVGAPLELYHKPQNQFVAGFIGSPQMNFLSGTIAAPGQSSTGVAVPGLEQPITAPVQANGHGAGTEVKLGIRPEHIEVGDPGPAAPLAGEIFNIERLGSETLYYTRTEAGDVVATTDGTSSGRIGDRIGLHLPPAECHVFDHAEQALPRQVEVDTSRP